MIFESTQIFNALIGGVLIGLSATIMFLFKGRITGVSGIFSGAFSFKAYDLWKVFFIFGLLGGGFLLQAFRPESFYISLNTPMTRVIIAGVLVGFGTRLGSGCTSGHGVCGISRLSKRSILATLCFIGSGVLTVLFFGVS